MKTETTKSINHEVGYIAGSTATLVVLSILIFPLFIFLIPMALLYGCSEIWFFDHLKNGKRKNQERLPEIL